MNPKLEAALKFAEHVASTPKPGGYEEWSNESNILVNSLRSHIGNFEIPIVGAARILAEEVRKSGWVLFSERQPTAADSSQPDEGTGEILLLFDDQTIYTGDLGDPYEEWGYPPFAWCAIPKVIPAPVKTEDEKYLDWIEENMTGDSTRARQLWDSARAM